jgi:NTE family protein
MKPLYLALSGGGAHAAAHIGFLRGLDEAQIPIAGIAGVSGGALAAAAWAGGGDLDMMIDRASNLHPWVWVRGWGGGLLSGSRLGVMIEEFLPAPTFDRLRVPLWVLCTDLDSGEPVVLKDGDLREAVRASCSFPGVFPPMQVGSRRLVCGEVSEVVPVRVARQMAGDDGLVLAADCNAGARWPSASSFTAIAVRAGLTLVRGRTREDLLGADLVIAPQIGESGWMRPKRIPGFAEAGLEAARATVPELRRLVELDAAPRSASG